MVGSCFLCFSPLFLRFFWRKKLDILVSFWFFIIQRKYIFLGNYKCVYCAKCQRAEQQESQCCCFFVSIKQEKVTPNSYWKIMQNWFSIPFSICYTNEIVSFIVYYVWVNTSETKKENFLSMSFQQATCRSNKTFVDLRQKMKTFIRKKISSVFLPRLFSQEIFL